jgi:hypothetical protein
MVTTAADEAVIACALRGTVWPPLRRLELVRRLEANMDQLERSDTATRRLQIIWDAIWLLERDSPTSALAILLSELNETNRELALHPETGRTA